MNTATAERLIANLIFFPEWQLRTDTLWCDPGCIRLTVAFETRNTNEGRAPLGYPDRFTAAPSFQIDVRGLDEEQLYRKVADTIIRVWEHETREALRVQPTRARPWFWAPFHPHKPEGRERWARGDRASLRADATYGTG